MRLEFQRLEPLMPGGDPIAQPLRQAMMVIRPLLASMVLASRMLSGPVLASRVRAMVVLSRAVVVRASVHRQPA